VIRAMTAYDPQPTQPSDPMPAFARLLLATSLATLLAACAGGPTDAEVEAAMKARIEGMASGDDAPSVTSAKNRGCTAGSVDGTYSCEVELDLVMPGMGAMKNVGTLTMVQDGGKWTYDKGQVVSMQPR
jgi:hypothetical protein